MKKFLAIAAVFVILALDWAALDDITTGREPDFTAEYAILITSLPALLFVRYLYRNTNKT
ncbi:MAG: hypothetical protein UX59_C0022G0008 [Microgenomates group bacterium GW2011_GWA1_46_7]|nr:MAG: hypothetical protein UX59_C0022G0008 [Microgenomates group bacterium GW2011_GWA1_46_7]